jgi:hypothetical protein
VLLSNLDIASDPAVTVEFWMDNGTVPFSMPFGFNQYDLVVQTDGNGHDLIGFNTGQGDLYGVQVSNLRGQWHHIAAVFDNGNIDGSKLYVDGVLLTLSHLFGTSDNGFAVLDDSPHIGGWGVNTVYSFDGQMDNVAIWNGVRSASEIAADMNGINPSESGLAAFYSFENTSDGSGGVVDNSGRNHDGTLSGLTTASNIIDDDVPWLSGRTLYGVSISDVGNPDDQFTVTATAQHGTVTPNGGTATLDQINDALAAGLIYTPDGSNPSTDIATLTVADSKGHSDTTHFVFNVTEMNSVSLTGTTGKDVIFATGYNDTLTGNGGADTFVFRRDSGTGSHDTITDFQQGQNKIELDGFFTGNSDPAFTALVEQLQQAASTVHDIGLGNNQVITLTGVNVNKLQTNDFIVHSG